MVLVVPDEDLYEQGGWPSLFNTDHKATFRLGGEGSWSPASYDIQQIVSELPEATIISCERQDESYNYRLRMRRIGGLNRFLYKVQVNVIAMLVSLGADKGGFLCCLTLRFFRILGKTTIRKRSTSLTTILKAYNSYKKNLKDCALESKNFFAYIFSDVLLTNKKS